MRAGTEWGVRRATWWDWLAVYRLRNWEHKVNLSRFLLYVVLAWMMAGAPWGWRISGVLIAVTALLMYAGAWSDYWDFVLEGQRNALGMLVRGAALSQRQALGMVLLPLPAVIGLSVLAATLAVEPATGAILGALTVLVTVYASPPVRLKVRRPLGFFAAPLGAALTFVAAWGSVASWRPLTWWMACALFLFHCYAECLHVMDDASVPGETRKLPFRTARLWAGRLPLCSVVWTGALALRWPVFVVGIAGGLVRWLAVRSMDGQALHRQRVQIWSPLLFLPEFCVYGVIGALHLAW